MARCLQDVREAIEPQQRKCYLCLSHQKKVTRKVATIAKSVTEWFATIIMLHKEYVPLVLTHDAIIILIACDPFHYHEIFINFINTA